MPSTPTNLPGNSQHNIPGTCAQSNPAIPKFWVSLSADRQADSDNKLTTMFSNNTSHPNPLITNTRKFVATENCNNVQQIKANNMYLSAHKTIIAYHAITGIPACLRQDSSRQQQSISQPIDYQYPKICCSRKLQQNATN